jgi:hypothetical protein
MAARPSASSGGRSGGSRATVRTVLVRRVPGPRAESASDSPNRSAHVPWPVMDVIQVSFDMMKASTSYPLGRLCCSSRRRAFPSSAAA